MLGRNGAALLLLGLPSEFLVPAAPGHSPACGAHTGMDACAVGAPATHRRLAATVQCTRRSRTCHAEGWTNTSDPWGFLVDFEQGLRLEVIPLHAEVVENQLLHQFVLFRVRAPTFVLKNPPLTTTVAPATTTTTTTTTTQALVLTTTMTSTATSTTLTTTSTATTTATPSSASSVLAEPPNVSEVVANATTTAMPAATASHSTTRSPVLNLAPRKAGPTRCATQHAAYTVYHVPAAVRPPEVPRKEQDLAIVLDVSVAVSEDTKLDRAKRAIALVVNDLRDGDRLTFITFDPIASVRFEHMGMEKRRDIVAMLEALRPARPADKSSGSAAAAAAGPFGPRAGLEVAQAALERGEGAAHGRLQRIFLFSDGLAVGGCEEHAALLESAERLQRGGVLTSAFALGGDFDRSLVPAIAEAGRGRFASLATPEALDVPRMAAAEIGPFAAEAQLFLTPVRGAHDLHVHGHRRRRAPGKPDAPQVGAAEAVPLGALRYFGGAEVLASLRLPPLLAGSTFLSYELALRPSGATGISAVLSGHVSIDVLRSGAKAAAPHRGVDLYKGILDLLLHDDAGLAAREDVKQSLGRLAADAMRAEQADPSIRDFGLAARALAAHERLR